MAMVYLLLGTNLGERLENLRECVIELEKASIQILQSSCVYETAPWGYIEQPSFYNQALSVSTTMGPSALLSKLKEIEQVLGRVKVGRWRERKIDIDILYYDNLVVEDDLLKIPHVQIQHRRFTLIPLCEIAPNLVHPLLKKSNNELLNLCEDDSEVTRLQEH